MSKKIYDILNDTVNKEEKFEQLNDLEVNQIMKKLNERKKNENNISRWVMGITAVAACAAVLAFSPMIAKNIDSNKGVSSMNTVKTQDVQKNEVDSVTDSAKTDVKLDLGVKYNYDNGVFPYSGDYFYITGSGVDEIKTVTVSIDKGNLYKFSNDSSEKREFIGNNYTEDFVAGRRYGFYLSDEIYKKYDDNGNGDPKETWHRCIDGFNGATLTISAVYNDGTTESVSYRITSGKLELNEETMKFNGRISDGSTPYIYGLHFEKIV